MASETRSLRGILIGVVAGAICGLLAVVNSVSNAALIFSGALAPAFPVGAGLALFSSCVLGLFLAIGSTYRGAVAIVALAPASILGLMADAVLSTPGMSSSEAAIPTVLATIMLTSLLAGAFFYLLGAFRLGGLPRYIPFPVIGGFLGGIGWLLVVGAIEVATDLRLNLARIGDLAAAESLRHLAPTLALGGFLLWMQRRFGHFLVMPGIVVGSIALFYGLAAWNGDAIDALREAGWLMGKFPDGALWPPQALATLAHADFAALAGQLPRVGTILIIMVLTLLLYATSLELTTGQEVDPDRELRVTGAANVVAALGGGMPGHLVITLSLLGHRMAPASRAMGVTTALICGFGALAGASLIALIPKFVIAGVLLASGAGLLVEWLWRGRSKLPPADYLIVLLIVLVVSLAGFLQGVAVGIVAGVVLFAVNYSRIDVVKHTLSGASFHSNVDRPERLARHLAKSGDQIHILKLQGYLFFGTAHKLLSQIRTRLGNARLPPVRFVLLDFRQVHGVDSSAAASFLKLRRDADQRDFRIVLANLGADVGRQLQRGGFLLPNDVRVITFADFDHGLEWCEDQLLSEVEADAEDVQAAYGWQGPAFSDPAVAAALRSYFEPVSAAEGEFLMRQGDRSDDLLFIESGRVAVQLEIAGGRSVRLRAFGPGAVVGEIAMYLGIPRSASIIADRPTQAYRVSVRSLERMKQEHPELVAEFHQYIARLLAERLSDANKLLRSVLD